jgi:hypothetical protein
MFKSAKILFAAVSAFGIAGGASAATKIESGIYNGMVWEAQSRIVGQTSTGTIASGGNPIYTATFPQYSGTVGLLMDFGSAGSFVCSGSLLNDRRSILTAAHCVSDGFGTANPIKTTAFFRGPGSNADTFVYPTGTPNPAVTAVEVSGYSVNNGYTGQVIDQNDVAVLRLSQFAPAFAESYGLYLDPDLTGDVFNVAGYGTRSVVGGAQGTTGPGAGAGSGRFRQGDNRFDFRLGEIFSDAAFGSAKNQFSWISDFDNGLAANDASCQLWTAGLGQTANAQYCNLGLGAREVGVAGGDSGGPGFINGQIASITSFGLTLGGYPNGDFKPGLQSSWGEFNGFVPTSIHKGFIMASMVPEPATWAMMIAGFGLVGGALRRRGAPNLATA